MLMWDWCVLEDRELSRVVDGLVGRVNGRFGYADYCPVNYVKRDLMVRWRTVKE